MKPCIPPDFYSLQDGYPYRMEGGRKIYVVRETLEKKLGRDLKEGEFSLSACDTKGCLEPEHLYVGTMKDRVAKTVKYGRQSKGSGRPTSKLTEDDVKEVKRRLESGEDGKTIAAEYSVSASQISRVKNNKTWTHVRGDYE